MNHLTDHELVDALDGNLTEPAATHIRECEACQGHLAHLAETLASTRQAGVPDPSPLFWDHLSARIRAAIAAQPPPGRRWFEWPVLAPLGGLALIVFALVSGLIRELPPPREAMATRDDVLLAGDAAFEAAWALTATLIDAPESEALAEADLVVAPGSAESAVASLTPDERAELVRLLQMELKVGG